MDGLLHISDMSWTRNIGHPSELLKKGQAIETQILNVDRDNKRISLGLKQIQPDPWETRDASLSHGIAGDRQDRAPHRLRRLRRARARGGRAPAHLPDVVPSDRGTPADIVNVGDELTLMVIRVDPNERRIGLSLKELAAIVDEPMPSDSSRPPEGTQAPGRRRRLRRGGLAQGGLARPGRSHRGRPHRRGHRPVPRHGLADADRARRGRPARRARKVADRGGRGRHRVRGPRAVSTPMPSSAARRVPGQPVGGRGGAPHQ